MKKTLKSILALTLALIMSFGTLTVFAAEDDTLKWFFKYDEVTVEHKYFGELKEGVNKISTETDTYNRYYTFNAEEGYYLFTKGDYIPDESYIGWVFIPEEIKEGIACNTETSVLSWWEPVGGSEEEEQCKIIYRLDAGENIIGVNAEVVPETEAPELKIEYLGKSITGFDIAANELLINYDIERYSEEGWLNSDASITFDNTKTLNTKNSEIRYTCEEIKEGENVLTCELGDVTKDITVAVYPLDHFVANAELMNADHYTQEFVDYEGDFWYYRVYGDAVTVTFTDSTVKDVILENNWGTVEFPNGRNYNVSVYHDYNDDNERVLYIEIAGKAVKEYECTVTEYSVIENGEILAEDNKSEFADFLDEIYWSLDDATYFDTVSEIFTSLFGSFFDTLINASDLFGTVFENIIIFIKHYLVG